MPARLRSTIATYRMGQALRSRSAGVLHLPGSVAARRYALRSSSSRHATTTSFTLRRGHHLHQAHQAARPCVPAVRPVWRGARETLVLLGFASAPFSAGTIIKPKLAAAPLDITTTAWAPAAQARQPGLSETSHELRKLDPLVRAGVPALSAFSACGRQLQVWALNRPGTVKRSSNAGHQE